MTLSLSTAASLREMTMPLSAALGEVVFVADVVAAGRCGSLVLAAAVEAAVVVVVVVVVVGCWRLHEAGPVVPAVVPAAPAAVAPAPATETASVLGPQPDDVAAAAAAGIVPPEG